MSDHRLPFGPGVFVGDNGPESVVVRLVGDHLHPSVWQLHLELALFGVALVVLRVAVVVAVTISHLIPELVVARRMLYMGKIVIYGAQALLTHVVAGGSGRDGGGGGQHDGQRQGHDVYRLIRLVQSLAGAFNASALAEKVRQWKKALRSQGAGGEKRRSLLPLQRDVNGEEGGSDVEAYFRGGGIVISALMMPGEYQLGSINRSRINRWRRNLRDEFLP